MVVVKLIGGLGNQLFQCALGIRLAQKLNTDLKLDVSLFEEQILGYEWAIGLSAFGVNYEMIDSSRLKMVKEENAVYLDGHKLKYILEKTTGFIPKILDCPDDVFLEGYWQSGKYFENIADTIRKKLQFRFKPGRTAKYWREKIKSEKFPVALHVRRSSYMRPLFRWHCGILPVSYYEYCVRELKKSVGDIKIFVFSHELNWARENLKLDAPMEFVEGCERDVEEMYLMSLCKHNIIANSTFSWWGAWFNLNPNKKIFAPRPWHRDGWGGDTVAPDDWFKVPANFIEFPPFLSVIIFADKNTPALQFALNGSLQQTFNDHEVIVISTSGEQNNLCRQFANHTNVTVLTVAQGTSKETAWNAGLKCARGEYVLFLTDNEVILPNTLFLLGECWDFRSQAFSERDNYMVAANYDKISPNIMCSSRSLAENSKGELSLDIFPGKHFSFAIETPTFKETDKFATFQTEKNDKLSLLASRSFAPSLATKIFKRKFLLKHNLKFEENSSDAELLFWINAFFLTDEITLTNDVFLCRFDQTV